jgi:hypothetical protein
MDIHRLWNKLKEIFVKNEGGYHFSKTLVCKVAKMN